MRYLLIVFIWLCSGFASAADWVDDWFDNAVSTGPSSFKSQKRGFYSLGGFQGRINTSVDHPISVQLPKLSSGCGGVNLFYGGVSFMDEAFLVQKLENAMQAAPAIAFDMAIKTVTKEFSETLGKFEQIANQLNNLQLGDCAIAKSAVTTVVEGRYSDMGADIWRTVTNEQSLGTGDSKNYHDSQQKINTGGGVPTMNLSTQWQGCHGDFKDLFASPGSLVKKATDKFGMGQYADLVRGYVGDISIDVSAVGQIPVGRTVLPCSANGDSSMADFVYGSSQSRNEAGQCSQYLADGIKGQVETNLSSIADAIANKMRITPQLQSWIDQAPMPVYRIMHRATVDGTVEGTINETAELLSFAYADKMFNDLYRNARLLFAQMNKVFAESGQGANPGQQCNKNLFINVAPLLPTLEKRLDQVRGQMRQGYIAQLEEYQQIAEFIERQKRLEDQRAVKLSGEALGL
jgi:conjugative transfer pilus assembly protein TraH